MAIDTLEKRHAVASVGLPWLTNTLPGTSNDEQYRMSVGNVYGGNALSPVVSGGVTSTVIPRYYRQLMAQGGMSS